MTDILPWLAANLQFLGIVISVALAFLIILAAGGIWALGWYFWRWIISATEPEPLVYDIAFGDVPHVPEKAKRRAA